MMIKRIQSWIESERSHIQTEQDKITGKIGWFEFGLLITVALSLVVMNFFGDGEVFLKVWGDSISPKHPYWELAHLSHWVSSCLLGYLIIPLLYLKISGRSISEFYWSGRGLIDHSSMYLFLLIPATVMVYWVSHWSDFQLIYPFYSNAGRSWFDLIAWEVAYGLQFFALEFFFRAFMLQGLRSALGYGAIPIMIIPYCMIHFQKTAAESVGSVIAGLLLGWMAMKSRSLWGGVILHWVIAVEMDVMSLIQKGTWPPPQ